MKKCGNFDDLVANVKKFVELKKEKPLMTLRLNYVVTSDNYQDIPAAVKLYEGDLGLFLTFNLVMREKDDPQNIKERPDLYEGLLRSVEEGLRLSKNPFTQDSLKNIETTIKRQPRYSGQK